MLCLYLLFPQHCRTHSTSLCLLVATEHLIPTLTLADIQVDEPIGKYLLVIPGHLYIVAPLSKSMDARNWPCEPISFFWRLRALVWQYRRSVTNTVTEFDPQIEHLKLS